MKSGRLLCAVTAAVLLQNTALSADVFAEDETGYLLIDLLNGIEYPLTAGKTEAITLTAGSIFALGDSDEQMYMTSRENLSAPFTYEVFLPDLPLAERHFFVVQDAGTYQVTLDVQDDVPVLTVQSHTHRAAEHITNDPCAHEAYDLCECGAVLYYGAVTDRDDEELFSHHFEIEITKEPNCTESGEMDFICTECFYEGHREIPALGHLMTKVPADENAAIPETHWHCDRCGGNFADEAGTVPIDGSWEGMSGEYGGISWAIADGVLTVSGTGEVQPEPSLGDYPWWMFRDLIVSAEVGEGITALGYYAFAYMHALTRISLPDTLESVGMRCFEDDASLVSVAFPPSVKTVGQGALNRCSALKSASLPGVTDLPQRCFCGCTALEELTLSDELSHVSSGAFDSCEKLLTGDRLVTVGSVLISYSGSDRVVRIPEGITVIADGAFSYDRRGDLHYTADDRLIAVICPESLKHIGSNVFYSCAALAELELPDGLCSVGENAFEKCRSLHSLTIPESVTAIGTQNGHTLKEITGTAGTAAEQFAKSAGILFCDRDDLPAALTIDPQKDVWYFGNSGKVFGKEYFFTERDRALVDELDTIGLDEKLNGPWTGSCFGLSLTVLLAAYGVFTPDMLQAGAKTLSEVGANPDIVSMINYYHVIAASKDYLEQAHASSTGESVPQMVWRMIRTADQKPLLIDMTTKNGSHAMLAYGTEQGKWEWNGKTYDGRVTVWDSNYPTVLNERSCVYFDSNTLDCCIPQYGVTVTEGESAAGGINAVCGDLSILNAHPYPFAKTVQAGDMDCNGKINAADAVLLMRCVSEDRDVSVQQAGLDAADLDGDGLVTIRDAQKLLEQLAGFV